MTKFGLTRRVCAILVLSAAATVVSPAQTLTTLVNFNGANGDTPQHGSLTLGQDGNTMSLTLE